MSREQSVQTILEQVGGIFKGLGKQFRHCLHQHQLTHPQLEIIFALKRAKTDLSVKELAEQLNVTSGAITQFVDGLVDKKLVTRTDDPTDRRRSLLTLNPTLKHGFTALKKDYFNEVTPLFDELTDAEIENLLKLVNKIHSPKEH